MSKKRHKSEEIVSKLRQIDLLTSQRKTVTEAIRSIGALEQRFVLAMPAHEFSGA